jgi:magnesium-transporting ATPase (P-type)
VTHACNQTYAVIIDGEKFKYGSSDLKEHWPIIDDEGLTFFISLILTVAAIFLAVVTAVSSLAFVSDRSRSVNTAFCSLFWAILCMLCLFVAVVIVFVSNLFNVDNSGRDLCSPYFYTGGKRVVEIGMLAQLLGGVVAFAVAGTFLIVGCLIRRDIRKDDKKSRGKYERQPA